MTPVVFIAVIAGCSVTAFIAVVTTGVFVYKYSKKVDAAADVDYPANVNPAINKLGSGDRKLAQSAQMYHYQHQKQQMMAQEKANSQTGAASSEDESDCENEEGEYTVYECPGLAPTGAMEVKNPLFRDQSSVSPRPVSSEMQSCP